MSKISHLKRAAYYLTGKHIRRNRYVNSSRTIAATSWSDGLQFSRVIEQDSKQGYDTWRDVKELILLPLSMGIGHLPLTFATLKATKQDLKWSVLILVATMATFVDALDKYRDCRRSRPIANVIWKPWMVFLTLSAFYGMISSGWQITILVQRFLIVGLLWASPCIPVSYENHIGLAKPKVVLCEYKSLFVGIVMAMVCITPVMGIGCTARIARSDSCLWLGMLYEWIRETVYDVRDVQEDRIAGMRTLPIQIGTTNTFIGIGVLGLVMDVLLTNVITWRTEWSLHLPLLSASVARICLILCSHSFILRYPKGSIVWGIFSTFSLLPAMWALQSI